MIPPKVLEDVPPAAPAEAWGCRNCGQQNPADATDCARCGFRFDFDPEKTPAVDYDAVQAEMAQHSSAVARRYLLYWDVLKNVLLFVVLVYALMIGVRLYHQWPFRSSFANDASVLADAVLTVQGNVDNGVSLRQYDVLMVSLHVQETKFKLKYGERNERQREAFQKLVQSAEYYGLARTAWVKQLRGDDATGRLNEDASSLDAKDEVQNLWSTASSNALLALQDLD